MHNIKLLALLLIRWFKI